MKPPFEKTHDITSVNFHARELEIFGQVLTDATAAAFPNEFPREGSRYDKVYVLFLSWEGDLLGVSREIAELRDVFRHSYHYNTEEWHIPNIRSHNSLVQRISEFLEDYEDRENLLIVYYAGHGCLNDDRQLVGACHATPTMKWLGIQNMLEQAESDVLILLDCCAGASSASEAGSGVTEVIAACGFETLAPGVSEHSFTRILIDELRYWCGNPSHSVAMLHMRLLAAMKHWKPRSSRTRDDERRKTPVHTLLGNQGHSRSIQLIPLPLRPPLLAELPVFPAERPSSQSSGSHGGSPGNSDGNNPDSSQSSTSHVWSDPDFRAPKVLISLALEEDQWLSPNAWAEWLENIPAKVKSACVEGVYRSYSTLMLLSIPVAAWDMLPEDPAVNFVGFVRPDNLLQNAPLKSLLGECSISGQAQTLPIPSDSSLQRVSEVEERQYTNNSSWHSLHPVEPKELVQRSFHSIQPKEMLNDNGCFDYFKD